MQDFDDFDSDDIVLDEQTLAILDQAEKKYFVQNRGDVEKSPPPKRQKTWGKQAIGVARTTSADDLDYLPEISVRGDGSYGLRAREGVNGTVGETRSIAPLVQRQPHCPPPAKPTARGRASLQEDNASQAEELRRHLEELRNENMKIRSDLQQALDLRYSKEGEVAILRKGIEKTAQAHASQVAKLKMAKEEADAKQAQAQKEMKDEMERLRTQFTFKQHEIETSLKPPWSVRAKKIGKEPPATPLPVPSEIARWNQNRLGSAGPSKFGSDTPLGNRVKATPQTRKPTVQPNANNTAILPGFHNAFMPSPPVRGTQSRPDIGKARNTNDVKGKGKEFQPVFTSTFRPRRSPPSSPTPGSQRIGNSDVRGDHFTQEDDYQANTSFGVEFPEMDVEMMNGEDGAEVYDGIEPVNWKEELNRIILSHQLLPTSLTFQILMGVSLPLELPAQSAEAYSAASTTILYILSTPSTSCDWAQTTQAVSSAFAQMAQVLNTAHSIQLLAALLNLLSLLIFSLPSFGSAMLSGSRTESSHEQCIPNILEPVGDIIRNQLAPQRQVDNDADLRSLAKETFGFLEALCWKIPDELAERLASVVLGHAVLAVILHATQPTWILSRSTRLLVFLATHTNLSGPLLDPHNQLPNNGTKGQSSKTPYIEWLCSYLADTERHGEEADSMRISILTFIAIMSVSDAEALPVLLDSQTLIPSLVLFLAHLMNPIWEDDETLMASPTTVTSSIRTLNQALVLLHHLVFGTEPSFDLSHKLYHSPHRQFNGIIHIFIVTLGRLSYAVPPDWVDVSGRSELERMAGMARDLLEAVVEGPEGDSIWSVYRSGPEAGSEVDEEEMERLLADDN